MRQRTIKNIDEKLQIHKEPVGKLTEAPLENRGKWKDQFSQSSQLCLELGCGKGQFITKRAASDPDRNYIGVEGQPSVLLRALEKSFGTDFQNLKFIAGFIADPRDYFSPGELSAIYLNFSDPWPKARHEKRRLTSRGYLEAYQKILGSHGILEIKTDNFHLYEFTLQEIEFLGMKPEITSEDLHSTQLDAADFTTEYEDKFRQAGKCIYYIKLAVEVRND